MKLVINVLLLLFSIFSVAQTKTPTKEQATEFINKEDKTGFSFYYVYEDDEQFEFYWQKADDEIIISGTTIYKVVNHKIENVQNFNSIQLEKTLSIKEAVELEKIIIKKYMSGMSFAKLEEEYSIHQFTPGTEQERPVERLGKMGEEMQKHGINEIFIANDPETNSYNIVIKNNNPIPRKAVFMWKAEYN